MKPLDEYNIPFVGLKEGEHIFDYDIKKTFFDCFEYDEFNDSSVNILLVFVKKTTLLELSFKATGYVNLFCDVSNEPYNQSIESSFDLVVKFGESYNDDNESLLILPHGAYEINVAQFIYELVVLSIPQKRLHPGLKDGTLKSEILESLKDLSPDRLDNKSEWDIDPRWEKLKKLLTDK